MALVPLLASALAGAQPRSAARERQIITTRQLVLPTSTTGPLPEVRVAPSVPTTIVFDATLARDSVKLDGEGTRIRRVDVGDKSVILEPLVELGIERALLRVRFVDGAAPAEATLALVSDPAQVDSHVRVSRRAHSAEGLEKELAEVRARCEAREVELAELRSRCEATGLVALVLAGLLRRDDLSNADWLVPLDQERRTGGLQITTGSWMKVAPKWMLLAVRVKNEPGQPPWSPDKVTLARTKTNEGVEVRVAQMERPQLGPGEQGLVAVEAESPPGAAGESFRLELSETASGRQLPILFKMPSNKSVKP
jgi:uncharacterized protein (TIGR02268 family)